MVVNKNTWHYKVFNWINNGIYNEQISVCNYWSSVLIGAPVVGLLLCLVFPILGLIWLIDKILISPLQKLGCKAPSCPFGKVEFKQDGT